MPSLSQPWFAPAKLNLLLRIIGQREDGYHLLQTTFQFLDYADELYFDVTTKGGIQRLDTIPNVPLEADLIYRAAKLLQTETATNQNIAIKLNKKLPLGGGLGGGSSNAATTLVALNILWKLNLSIDTLAKIGLKLGADVPVFIRGFAAWAEGIGEKLEPIQIVEPWYLVVIPNCEVSTQKVFSYSRLTRDSIPKKISDFPDGRGKNDCLKVVLENYPAVKLAFDWLNQYAKATLTGTGACIFSSFGTKVEAQAILDQLPTQFSGFIAKGCNQSPLYGNQWGVAKRLGIGF